jgi:predicted ATPase
MLNRVQIKDYRCLRDVDVPLKPLTVLIGPNNTGKSAFLSAIKLMDEAPPEPNARFPMVPSDVWQLHTSTSPSITGQSEEFSDVQVDVASVGTGGFGPGRPQLLCWTCKGETSSVTPIALYNSIVEPSMLSAGAKGDDGIPQIIDDASNVPAVLDALLRKDRDRFLHVLETLRKLVPGLADLHIETPSAEQRRIDLEFESGLTMDASRASFGVKLLIFFVALANHPNPPRTVLVEEPENGIHPKRLEDVVRLLIGLSEGKFADRATQVILTTHSPYLLDCIDPVLHQVLVFQRQPDGSCNASPVDTERLKLFLDEFMLGEIWTNQEEAGLVEKGS